MVLYTPYMQTEASKRAARVYRQKVRWEVLARYSGGIPKCSCCGEMEVKFLTIDHCSGNENSHRREMNKAGTHMVLWLRKNKYPSGFQVLCWNCNAASGLYGSCPHKK